MRFARSVFSAKAALLFVAQVSVGLPAAAQQEVSPDHFDQKPAISQGQKPTPQARQSASQSRLKAVKHRTAAPKAKDASAAPPVLKASAAGNQSATQPR